MCCGWGGGGTRTAEGHTCPTQASTARFSTADSPKNGPRRRSAANAEDISLLQTPTAVEEFPGLASLLPYTNRFSMMIVQLLPEELSVGHLLSG